MKVSIALCTWNGERFLVQQLESLLAQTRLPDELIITDDVSRDGTWSLLEAFAARARAQGIHVDLQRNPDNLGYVENFSRTLVRSSGELVFLCDQDDVWHPDKISRMTDCFVRRPTLGLLHSDARLIDADGADLGHGLFDALGVTRAEIEAEHAGDAFDVLMRRNIVTGATAVVRRDLIEAALPVPRPWIHDEWLAVAVSLRAQVDCLEWESIGYRQHGNNQIGVRRPTLKSRLTGDGHGKRVFMTGMHDRLLGLLAYCEQPSLQPSEARVSALRSRIAHLRFRSQLPHAPLPRLRAVVGEFRRGGYGTGVPCARSVLSDLMDLN